MEEKFERMYSLKEAAPLLNRKYRSMFPLLSGKRIRGVKIGHSWFITESEITYIRENGLRKKEGKKKCQAFTN